MARSFKEGIYPVDRPILWTGKNTCSLDSYPADMQWLHKAWIGTRQLRFLIFLNANRQKMSLPSPCHSKNPDSPEENSHGAADRRERNQKTRTPIE